MQTWITELRQLGPQNLVLAIAGNKLDLEESRRVCRFQISVCTRVCAWSCTYNDSHCVCVCIVCMYAYTFTCKCACVCWGELVR